MPERYERPPPLGPEYGVFWSIFERSRFPMALVDADGRYVSVNDDAVGFFGYPHERLIGHLPGRLLAPEQQARLARAWEVLKRTGEYYGDRIVTRADGMDLRIQYAAHASTVSGRWLAFAVVLSARARPSGPELIAPAAESEPDALPREQPRLTRREREIVRLVALGASNREIADRLYISPETVRSHLRNAMSKTSARTRAQLVAIALSEGLLEATNDQTDARRGPPRR
jgi:PAS domain S-box-containing protein